MMDTHTSQLSTDEAGSQGFNAPVPLRRWYRGHHSFRSTGLLRHRGTWWSEKASGKEMQVLTVENGPGVCKGGRLGGA